MRPMDDFLSLSRTFQSRISNSYFNFSKFIMKSTFMHSNVYLQYLLLSNVLTIQTLKRLKSWKHFKLHHVLLVSSKKMSSFLKRCKAALEDSIETLHNASLYSLKYGEELQSLVLKMDMLLCKERLESCKQRQVTDYFNIMK